MPKKTLFLITILSLITIGLMYFAIAGGVKTRNTEEDTETRIPNISSKPVLKTVELSFSPNEININPGVATPSSSADILINANQNKVSGVQLELTFDPKTISNVQLLEPQNEFFFGEKGKYVVLFKNVDYKNGRISYAVAISPSEQPKQGIGKIVTLAFNAKRGQDKETNIVISDKTMVTELNTSKSVLNNFMPLKITFLDTADLMGQPN